MNENELLLLGLLMVESRHGYQINEFIEKNLTHVTNMKKGNAYAILERLEKENLISVHMEQQGNRPQRKVYSITDKGREQFIELLKNNLSRSDGMVLAGNVGLMLLDHLPQPEVRACLELKLAEVKGLLAAHENLPKHGHGMGVDFAIERYNALLEADVRWLASAIARLQAV